MSVGGRRTRGAIAAIGLLLLLALIPAGAFAQGRSLHWEQYDVTIDLHPDGTFTVTEDQLINFTSGSFSEGFAVIPMDRIERISNIRVFENGEEYRRGQWEPGTYDIIDYGHEVEITWRFRTASSEIRNFTLQYDVAGGLRVYEETGREQLWWRVVDTEFVADVRRATLTLNLPAPVSEDVLAADVYTLRSGATSISMPDSTTIVFNAANLNVGDAFEARAEFPAMTTAVRPGWQLADDAAREREERLAPLRALTNLAFLALGVFLLVGGPVGSYLLWQAKGKDPAVVVPIDVLREPPDDLPPGAVGVLIDLQAHDHDVIATIVDLGERGVLHIEETGSNILGITFGRDWTIRKTGTTHGLRDYEKETISAIFGSRQEVQLTKIRERFSKQQAKVKEAMYQELVDHNYVEKNPQKVRRNWQATGFTIMIAGGGVGIFLGALISPFAPMVWFPIGALVVVGIAMLILAQQMPRRTEAGAEAAARWQAFKRYLEDIERYQHVDEAKAIFSSYLPFAVAFGIERSWVRKFARVNTPAPHWYGPYHSGGPLRRPFPRGQGGRVIVASGGLPTDARTMGSGGPTLQQMSSGMSTSLQSMSDGMFSMFSEASKVFKPYSSSSGSSGSFGGGGFSGGGGGSFGGGGGGGSRGFR